MAKIQANCFSNHSEQPSYKSDKQFLPFPGSRVGVGPGFPGPDGGRQVVMMKKSLRQEAPKCRGASAPSARLSQHDAKIIEVFASRRRKIIGSAAGGNPQWFTHTTRARTNTHAQSVDEECAHCCTFSVKKEKKKSLNKATRGLSPFSSTLFGIKAHLYSDRDAAAILSGPGRSHSPVCRYSRASALFLCLASGRRV